MIKAWGLGVNRVEPIELTLDLDEARPDGFLLAGRYSLLDHDRALQRVMPQAVEQGVGIVVGGPYSSGVTAGGEHFEYQKANATVLAKLERIRAVARAHGVDVKAAALQFALAHPAVVSVIPGSTRPAHANEDLAALSKGDPDGLLERPSPARADQRPGPGTCCLNRCCRAAAPAYQINGATPGRIIMATAQASITLATDANRVWQLIGGFDALPDWLPFIPESALSEGGRVRTLKSVAGDTIIERLLDFNEAGRSYSYTILTGPAPVRDYQSTLRVVAEGSGSRVEWSGSFVPVGVSDAEATALFAGIYEDGLAALKKGLEG